MFMKFPCLYDGRHLIDYMMMIIYTVKHKSRGAWMRVSREQAEKNRAHVIDTASRLFREKGYSGIGVADLMKEAGLTHGGFYGNFDSKENLLAAACAHAFEATTTRWRTMLEQEPETALARIVSAYLPRRHLSHPGQGCAMAALGGELARQSAPVRAITSDGVRAQVDVLAPLMAGATAADRRRAAMAAYAAMVGALVLARAVGDAGLADEIMASVQAGILPPG
jgi:TetR/AcrR family transcriptional repressor of nem operon